MHNVCLNFDWSVQPCTWRVLRSNDFGSEANGCFSIVCAFECLPECTPMNYKTCPGKSCPRQLKRWQKLYSQSLASRSLHASFTLKLTYGVPMCRWPSNSIWNTNLISSPARLLWRKHSSVGLIIKHYATAKWQCVYHQWMVLCTLWRLVWPLSRLSLRQLIHDCNFKSVGAFPEYKISMNLWDIYLHDIPLMVCHVLSNEEDCTFFGFMRIRSLKEFRQNDKNRKRPT